MRALVALLLLVDTALLCWGLIRQAPSAEEEISPPPLPIDVEALELLSEVSPMGERSVSTTASDGFCIRAAPFMDAVAVDSVIERARSLGHLAYVEPVEASGGPPDLQVHLPPLPSAEQASRAVRELHALGMEAYLVPGGPLVGAVSVGMFTARARAEVRRAEVAALGYPVRIAEIPRTRQVFEVYIHGGVPDSRDRLIESLGQDWPDVSVDRAVCKAAQR